MKRPGILIYDCYYVKHANPWNLGSLLEYDNENHAITNVKYKFSYLSEEETIEESISITPPALSTSLTSTTEEIVDNNIESDLCKQKENSICGFHVHQPIWNELCYGRGSQKNHPELNTFLRRIGANSNNFGKWFMSCASYQIPGARPKCAWFKWPGLVKYDSKDQCSHDDIYRFEQVLIIEARYQKWQYEKNLGKNIQSKYKYYNSQADKDLSNYSLMVMSERYTGIPKTYIAASFAVTFFFLIFFNIGGEIFSNLIGWVYPENGWMVSSSPWPVVPNRPRHNSTFGSFGRSSSYDSRPYQSTVDSFIFSLGDGQNIANSKLSRVLQDNIQFAVCSSQRLGPCFGQTDLRMNDGFDLPAKCTCQCYDYDKEICETQSFSVEEFEVFRVVNKDDPALNAPSPAQQIQVPREVPNYPTAWGEFIHF
ncbi:4517_t:CDS:2 [Entrophospora sp. SA101]|nr:11844_t:CDS:2 [Entrophospora sp. SA101]CAJ0855727.1 4517_t:CDS:2 [Entrophospora sp. SA101]